MTGSSVFGSRFELGMKFEGKRPARDRDENPDTPPPRPKQPDSYKKKKKSDRKSNDNCITIFKPHLHHPNSTQLENSYMCKVH